MAADHALEDVLEVGVGLAVVELGGDDQRVDDGPSVGPTVGAGEQMVLPSQHDRPDGPRHGVGIELDPAIVEESAEVIPADQRIAEGVGERTAQRHPMHLGLQPKLQGVDQRLGQFTAYRTTQLRRPTPDTVFDRIKLADPAQGLSTEPERLKFPDHALRIRCSCPRNSLFPAGLQ